MDTTAWTTLDKTDIENTEGGLHTAVGEILCIRGSKIHLYIVIFYFTIYIPSFKIVGLFGNAERAWFVNL